MFGKNLIAWEDTRLLESFRFELVSGGMVAPKRITSGRSVVQSSADPKVLHSEPSEPFSEMYLRTVENLATALSGDGMDLNTGSSFLRIPLNVGISRLPDLHEVEYRSTAGSSPPQGMGLSAPAGLGTGSSNRNDITA